MIKLTSILTVILSILVMEDSEAQSKKYQKALFGAGCFWGVEATFQQLKGVVSTSVGYSGGKTENPTYKEVCTDKTGHAEVVQVVFDPAVISYTKLVEVFFANHNPTTLNRQGPDFGSQYRSAIFYYSEEQKAQAEAAKKQLAEGGKWGTRPIVTEITPARPYFMAEDYHQKYLQKQGKLVCH